MLDVVVVPVDVAELEPHVRGGRPVARGARRILEGDERVRAAWRTVADPLQHLQLPRRLARRPRRGIEAACASAVLTPRHPALSSPPDGQFVAYAP